jgi:hypothetical protein
MGAKIHWILLVGWVTAESGKNGIKVMPFEFSMGCRTPGELLSQAFPFHIP